MTIRAPLIKMSKAEIIRAGVKLGIDYGLTHSCYDPAPSGAACGACDACQLRRRGFEAAESRSDDVRVGPSFLPDDLNDRQPPSRAEPPRVRSRARAAYVLFPARRLN